MKYTLKLNFQISVFVIKAEVIYNLKIKNSLLVFYKLLMIRRKQKMFYHIFKASLIFILHIMGK